MNLYLHFPFCRRKCAYCALHSRPGATAAERERHVSELARRAAGLSGISTVYMGGGSPALCALEPLFAALAPRLAPGAEFTVELHPLDVTRELLATLAAGGVNRVSMGVQSLDDATLKAMGRDYSFDDAERAFMLVREYFENAGIDLIVGYPGETPQPRRLERLAAWRLAHCSVYSLILEEGTALAALCRRRLATLPDDDATMDAVADMARFLAGIGLERYEISNYALPGRECRHNMAVWRGEDYTGLGEGAFGRIGLERTRDGAVCERVTPAEDLKERTIFRLRTREGLDASRFPQWRERLDAFVSEGLLAGAFPVYRLTPRGAEVCDSILAEL